ncbi:MAG: hypothetical protein LBV72_17985 [Tannerella sp.]|jgi:tetratricopeptide (TPR) repeat protein|nr:hypothetical protein [Tannerella sp.]
MDNTLGELIEKVEELIEYCDDTDFKEAVEYVDQYAVSCKKNGNGRQQENLAHAKYRLIEAFADYGASPKAEKHLADLCRLHEQTNDCAITRIYVDALVYLAGDGYLLDENENLDRACELHDTLKQLVRKNPHCELEESLMRAFVDFVYYYLRIEMEEEADQIFKELHKFYLPYAANEYMTYLYVRAFSYWIEFYIKQDDYESANEWFDTARQIPNDTDEGIIRTISGLTETLVELNIEHEQIRKAEELSATHRHLLLKETDERTKEIVRKRMAEILIALFNHYVLTKQIDAALLKYDELKQMEADTQHPDVAECYARAIYAIAIRHLKQLEFKEAVKCKEALEQLSGKYKEIKSDLTNYISMVLRGIATDSEEVREPSFREEALRQLKYMIERDEDTSIKYNYAVALADLVCIGMDNNRQTYQGYYLEELKKLVNGYPKISSLKEEYARALVFIAEQLTDKDESLGFMQIAASMPQPWDTDTFNQISRGLYNLIVKLLENKDFEHVEQCHQLHTELLCHPDIPAEVVLRQVKQLYNTHYDYSDKGDFIHAEEKYQMLKELYRKYVNASLEIDENPLGLEIAKRLALAAQNHAIDLRDKTPKKTFSLFGSPAKKSAKEIERLLNDVSLLVAKWKDYPMPEIANAYHKIKSIKL